ncbi:MAG: transporter [Hyphomicrobiales bacterium]|nr:transporter [Hyphomicrobiales bacterium]
MALGRVPGFKVDRAGAALVGAFVLQVTGAISMEKAWQSVDYSTMALLFGLMMVSAQFTMSGFYTAVTGWVAGVHTGPPMLLAVVIGTAGALSALLTNDVVAVAMAPLLVDACRARHLNPVPYLLALGFAANAGSVATIIGSPQNIVVAEALDLPFVTYTLATIVPALFAMLTIWLVLVFFYRGRWVGSKSLGGSQSAPVPFDRIEAVKGGLIALLVLVAFVFSDIPRAQIALGAAGLLLLNRHFTSRDMMREANTSLLIMLFGLFIVNAAFAATGLPDRAIAGLESAGVNLTSPEWLFAIAALASDIVGNTPAVILLTPQIDGITAGIAVTLASGLASNLVVFGSLATIIVVEAAKDRGIAISFAEFSRSGVPITIVSLAFAFAWVTLVPGA